MGRVLSQSEIDNLLGNLLNDASVLPAENSEGAETQAPEPAVPAGIAAFRAKLEAAAAANIKKD